MVVTIKDIAEKTGVSYATVSRALNGKYGVNSQTREIVLKKAAEMNYSPNAIARGLVKKQTRTIGLIIPDITNPFFPEVARGVEDSAEKTGYSVFLCNSNWEKEKEKKYVDLLVEKRVDGLILAPSSSIIEEYYRAVFSRLPVVLVSNAAPQAGPASVVLDNAKGGFLAGKRLIETGKKNLCFIGGAEDSFSVGERYKGFCAALESKGRSMISPEMVCYGDYRQKSGYNIMKKLLEPSRKPLPDGVFASNDLLAIGALQAIYEAGLRVPDDIAVIGFDNISAASYPGVELTTIEHPKYKTGEIAAELVLSLIEQAESASGRNIVLEPELIIRKTG